MRKPLLHAAAVLAVVVSACAGQGGGSSGSGKPILVGVSVSLDGDFSGDGKALEQGYQLWADDVNARGGLLGRKIQLKFVNDAGTTEQVVTNYQNLISRDRVDLTFGPFSSLLTIPASEVANRYGYAFPEPAGGGPHRSATPGSSASAPTPSAWWWAGWACPAATGRSWPSRSPA